ncbi:probable ADP-ribosylation factor [Fusarium torulosum]|uniref:ADP-ribosylation factor n=1 Tax=Fusarium torulosum TaxID=33205 RepID=A0AAE8M975_9HYPO|nr:probable ADP-ribosylation factor [Fusarium torulosum]
MGATISRLWTPEPIWVGLIGLRSAGKTAIVYRLSGNKAPVTPSVDTVDTTSVHQASQQFHLLDYTGEPKIRPCWRSFMTRVHAVVFVIDSSDRETLPEAKTELLYLLKEIMLDHQPFLIFANKQDYPKAMSAAELTEFLDIQQYLERDLKCCVQGSSAVTGDGLAGGLEWVRQAVRARQG